MICRCLEELPIAGVVAHPPKVPVLRVLDGRGPEDQDVISVEQVVLVYLRKKRQM